MCVLPVAACGGGGSTDIEGTLRFADRSDVEISRLVNAASGSEGFQAQAVAESYADPFEPGDPCPARAFAGDTGTITGGCTTQDGDAIEGTITIENPLGWCLVYDESAGWCDMEYEGNFGAATTYTFDSFTISQAGFARSFGAKGIWVGWGYVAAIDTPYDFRTSDPAELPLLVARASLR
jgi:hypothetical protein